MSRKIKPTKAPEQRHAEATSLHTSTAPKSSNCATSDDRSTRGHLGTTRIPSGVDGMIRPFAVTSHPSEAPSDSRRPAGAGLRQREE